MEPALHPVPRRNLADDVARQVRQLIERRKLEAGDRLPSIASMAKQFHVGAPTLREALRKLEAVGAVSIRHGSGVFVAAHHDALLVSNADFAAAATRKLLIDLIDARIPIELQSASLAAANATPEHLAEMRRLLGYAGQHLDDDTLLNRTNLAFHQQIALASANTVLKQLLDVLASLFREEQAVILAIHGSRRNDHVEHVAILQAVELHDAELAATRMRAHLEGVRDVLRKWDPAVHPVSRTGQGRR